MIQLGGFAISMGDFTEWAKLILSETAKYVFILLFVILAFRLWRRTPKLSGKNRGVNSLLAVVASIIACVVGYFSFCHSMGRLYSHYGMQAFLEGHPSSALSLFSKSSQFWNTADTLGNEGVCLLWTGQPDTGTHLLEQARTAHWGENSAFQNYYEGLYYLYNGQTNDAIPLLEAASSNPIYHWNVVKLFATIQLDWNHPQVAEQLMAPFKGASVVEMDQAYVVASLDLAEGKKTEAQQLWKQFTATNLPPFWQSRFDKLGAKIQNQNP
jgi:hypothetical protein